MNSRNLSVTIDPSSGFCFGVVYAIEMAEEMLEKKGYLYCLGGIVHNDEEINRLKKKGLQIIDHQKFDTLRNECVLIRAHGEPPSTYQTAIENNITLIDATCPVILKLQNRIRTSYDKKESIYLLGKAEHAEVTGLMGQINNDGTVFSDVSDLESVSLPSALTLYTQTTKSRQKFREVKAQLELKGIQVKAHDTVCSQVSDRDNQLRSFVRGFDAILFVSGTQSSNGRVLFETCKSENPNTFFVTRLDELKSSWFKNGDAVGICGATSTPLWLMQDIRKAVLEGMI